MQEGKATCVRKELSGSTALPRSDTLTVTMLGALIYDQTNRCCQELVTDETWERLLQCDVLVASKLGVDFHESKLANGKF